MLKPMLKLKGKRTEKGYNQQAFADELKMSRAMLSLYETGKSSPTLDILRRMAKVLECDVKDIID